MLDILLNTIDREDLDETVHLMDKHSLTLDSVVFESRLIISPEHREKVPQPTETVIKGANLGMYLATRSSFSFFKSLFDIYGYDFFYLTSNKDTILHYAAMNKNLKTLDFLIQFLSQLEIQYNNTSIFQVMFQKNNQGLYYFMLLDIFEPEHHKWLIQKIEQNIIPIEILLQNDFIKYRQISVFEDWYEKNPVLCYRIFQNTLLKDFEELSRIPDNAKELLAQIKEEVTRLSKTTAVMYEEVTQSPEALKEAVSKVVDEWWEDDAEVKVTPLLDISPKTSQPDSDNDEPSV